MSESTAVEAPAAKEPFFKMSSIPGANILVPLLLGCLLNTLFPDLFKTLGSFTLGMTQQGAGPLVGAFLLIVGTTISFKSAPAAAARGAIIIAVKQIVVVAVSLLILYVFNDNLFGISAMVMLAACTGANNAMYAELIGDIAVREDNIDELKEDQNRRRDELRVSEVDTDHVLVIELLDCVEINEDRLTADLLRQIVDDPDKCQQRQRHEAGMRTRRICKDQATGAQLHFSSRHTLSFPSATRRSPILYTSPAPTVRIMSPGLAVARSVFSSSALSAKKMPFGSSRAMSADEMPMVFFSRAA